MYSKTNAPSRANHTQVDHKIELMEQAQKSAVGPEMLPNEILRSIGCCALRDLGGMAWVSYDTTIDIICFIVIPSHCTDVHVVTSFPC